MKAMKCRKCNAQVTLTLDRPWRSIRSDTEALDLVNPWTYTTVCAEIRPEIPPGTFGSRRTGSSTLSLEREEKSVTSRPGVLQSYFDIGGVVRPIEGRTGSNGVDGLDQTSNTKYFH